GASATDDVPAARRSRPAGRRPGGGARRGGQEQAEISSRVPSLILVGSSVALVSAFGSDASIAPKDSDILDKAFLSSPSALLESSASSAEKSVITLLMLLRSPAALLILALYSVNT